MEEEDEKKIKEKVSWAPAFSSLCFLMAHAGWGATSCSWHQALPIAKDHTLKLWADRDPFFLGCFCLVVCPSNKKNNGHSFWSNFLGFDVGKEEVTGPLKIP